MTKKMLIDATHPEETRVAIVDHNILADYDYESIVRKQMKSNIYLAKVTRVEPSLQAAFVNFGANRHGFLPFSEIHPDYFRIPVSDQEAFVEAQKEEIAKHDEKSRAEEDGDDTDVDANEETDDEDEDVVEVGGADKPASEDDDDAVIEDNADAKADTKAAKGKKSPSKVQKDDEDEHIHEDDDTNGNVKQPDLDADDDGEEDANDGQDVMLSDDNNGKGDANKNRGRGRGRGGKGRNNNGRGRHNNRRMASNSRKVEMVGGDGVDSEYPFRFNLRRNYKIQEVVKRGQIMLIQVSKEERGNKGAAVTSYLSLPGRYCVLMPNSPRAGGVSRKIANYKDRKRMKGVLDSLEVPEGMSVILRTAGVQRTKAEIKRDLDYLLRLWNNIRELTLKSSAPAVVYEEGNLIKRSIRDLYTRDIEEIQISGEEGYKAGRDFMKMLIPSHVKRVKEYKDDKIPLFHREKVESQIAEIGETTVKLKSGGYLVINPTEALVSVDVNSGRATKERHIEETALKTNLESADEVARQLRLRDLGGLVVIDFIDMEDRRNNRKVENRLRDALSSDRARIQIGRISSFGLLELSRQRLNPSLTEAMSKSCPACLGAGTVKSDDAAAIRALRLLEEEGIKGKANEISLSVPADCALYILNHKRQMLVDIEQRYAFKVHINVDDSLAIGASTISVLGKKSNAQDDDNKPQDNDNNQGSDDDKSPRGRRRGRRGGRKRNQPNKNNDDAQNDNDGQGDQEQPQVKADTLDGDDNNAKDNVKDKPKGRKPSPRRKPKPVQDENADDSAAATVDVKKAEDDKPAPKKRGRKPKADKHVDEKPSDAPAKADAKKNEKKPAKAVKAKPSNDAGKGDDTKAIEAPKEYEVVNEAPKEKKKGWWNKLVD